MTEADWRSSPEPQPMLRYLTGTTIERVGDLPSFPHQRGSDRKLRLFACACYARLDDLLPDTPARAAVAVAERFADGLADAGEMSAARRSVRGPLDALEPRWRASRGAERADLFSLHEALALAWQVLRPLAAAAAYYASSNAYLFFDVPRNADFPKSDVARGRTRRDEERAQADLLRCVFGNPFRPTLIDPARLPAAAVSIARGVYDNRAFGRLPEIAEALKTSADPAGEAADHCGRAGEHVRGCWVVDQVLGQT
ncbi:MAG TPA: hypothetical protein VF796_22355 [Humisphaera sp.]